MNVRNTQLVGLGLLLGTVAVMLAAYRQLATRSGARPPPLAVLGVVPDFTLTNELGQPVKLASLRGQAWLADIVFTRCAGPCPKLTRRMSELQAALPAELPARLVTFTVDPDFDTPPILKAYAQRYGAAPGRWLFLTGTQHELYTVIVKGLKLVATPTEPANQKPDEDLFMHSTKCVLIDQRGRIRAYYDGLDPAAKPRMLDDLATLAKESSS